MTDRTKPGVAFWATVGLVVVLVGYPLNFGPACWISSRVQPSGEAVSLFYRPVAWVIYNGPDWITNPIGAYGFFMAAEGTSIKVSDDPLHISFE